MTTAEIAILCTKIFALLPRLLDPIDGSPPRAYQSPPHADVLFVRSDCAPCSDLLHQRASLSTPTPSIIVFLESDRLSARRKVAQATGRSAGPSHWEVFTISARHEETLYQHNAIATPLLCRAPLQGEITPLENAFKLH
jgi:hypothetical protein